MKHTIIRVLSVLLLATMLLGLVACTGKEEDAATNEHVDYAGELKLDMTSNTLKQEVDVHIYIDGDMDYRRPQMESSRNPVYVEHMDYVPHGILTTSLQFQEFHSHCPNKESEVMSDSL